MSASREKNERGKFMRKEHPAIVALEMLLALTMLIHAVVLMAQQLNTGNGDALHTIACMAQAIARNVSLTELTEDERGVMAHFKNPAMPSVAVTADAAIKIATARKEFASTDTFLEMIGFDQADIRRIRAQEQRARGQALLMEMDDADNDTDVE